MGWEMISKDINIHFLMTSINRVVTRVHAFSGKLTTFCLYQIVKNFAAHNLCLSSKVLIHNLSDLLMGFFLCPKLKSTVQPLTY